MRVRETRPVDPPHAFIDTSQHRSLAPHNHQYDDEEPRDAEADRDPQEEVGQRESLDRLMEFAQHNGNLCKLLSESVINAIGQDAVREWEYDNGTRADWLEKAERALDEVSQEDAYGDEDGGTGKDTPWTNASNIHYPILTKASLDWNARAYPELVKDDKLVKARTFDAPTPPDQPQVMPPAGPPPVGHNGGPPLQNVPQPQNPTQQPPVPPPVPPDEARAARAKRLAMFLNFTIFTKMNNWETDTDLLMTQGPVIGQGFKKVYMSASGVQSDFVSALDLCVDHGRTKSLRSAPRKTHEFEKYPYEIDELIAADRWSDLGLLPIGPDPEEPRRLIEQYRNEDLDEDGVAEPYIVTVDVETHQVFCIEAAYTSDDVVIDETDEKRPRVLRFDRWGSFASFTFWPDPKGRFYGMGLGRVLWNIATAVDTAVNQLMDANTAAVSGGGFVGAGVRLQGGGQGGSMYFRPGEYQTVSVPGGDIRTAIWEKTLPAMGPQTMDLLNLLLTAAKDLASVKDVLSGEGPQNAPVGTTLAIQQQAMQAFTAVFKRYYRGFAEEANLIFQCLKRWKRAQDKAEYARITGGDFDADFEGDDSDICLVADPNVVSKLMKISRVQALTQLAESQVGQAAGMLQPGPAKELAKEALDAMDIERPDRFLADAPPNPEAMAKVADLQASATKKNADAGMVTVKTTHVEAEANLDRAKAIRELGLAAEDTHGLNKEADRIATTGMIMDAPEEENNGQAPAAPGPQSGPQSAGPPSPGGN